jgi:excinuclease ABC subunit A
MGKPDVDLIEGLSPAISIEQKTTSKNPRSTVGTVTEIHDYMRLLWARVGVPYSPATGLPIESQTISHDGRQADRPARRRTPAAAGPGRSRPQGRVQEGDRRVAALGLPAPEDRRRILRHRGRADARQEVQARHRHRRGPDRHQGGARAATPTDLQTALGLAEGIAVAEWANAEGEKEPRRITFSEKFACPVSGFTISEIEPRLFSFNNPFGACPACDGLGVKLAFDADLVIPDRDKTLHKGAVAPWSRGPSPLYTQTLQSLSRHYGFSMDKPWRDLPEKAQDVILRGSGGDKIKFVYDDNARKYEV